jgi:hypothetical protein
MNDLSCPSYSEYEKDYDNDQDKNEEYLKYGDHRVKLVKQMDLQATAPGFACNGEMFISK